MKFILLTLLSFAIIGCGGGSPYGASDSNQSTEALTGTDTPFIGNPANFAGFWSGNCKLAANPQMDCKSSIQISQTPNTFDIQITQVVNYQYQQLSTRSFAISGNNVIELTSSGNGISGLNVGVIGAAGIKLQTQGFAFSLIFQNTTAQGNMAATYDFNGGSYSVTGTLKR